MSRIGSRTYAIAATMNDEIEASTWESRGLSKLDVIMAMAMGSQFRRINSIEFGLKHIIANEIGNPFPWKHELDLLWNNLTDEWKNRISE